MRPECTSFARSEGVMRATGSPTATAFDWIRTLCCRQFATTAKSWRRLQTGARVVEIKRSGGAWSVATEKGERLEAPILINAAGSWADDMARLARVRPWGFSQCGARSSPSMPRRGRSLIAFPSPRRSATSSILRPRAVGFSPRRWTKCQASRWMRSRTILRSRSRALRMEERTSVKIARVHSKWAGLRTFTPDRHPVVGLRAGC